MKTLIRVATFFCIPISNWSLPLLGDSPNAYLLPKGQFETSVRLWKVNDGMDLLGLKPDLAPGSPDTAGDMQGTGLSIKAGVHRKLTLMLDRDRRQYDYGRDQLTIYSEQVSARIPIFDKVEREPIFALQVSHRNQTGNNLSRLFGAVSLNNANFTFNPPVSLTFSGVRERELALMLIATKQLKPKLTGSLFYEYSEADIMSGIATTLPSPQIQQTLDPISYEQHKDRFGYSLNWRLDSANQLSMDYNYMLLSRSKDVSDPVDVNRIINAAWSHELKTNHFVNLQARYMENQFIGEHNFLYNTLVASRSARRYGYLGLGYSLKFDLMD